MTIIVVGAGVIGCAVAHALASRGATVRLIDARGPGLGATRASAGMLAPHIEGHSDALRTLGVNSLRLYDEFIRRAADDAAQRFEYERGGTLQVAATPVEMAELAARAEALALSTIPHVLLDDDGVRQAAPSLRADLVGGLHVPEHGYVAAGPLTRALAAAATARGATMTIARVQGIDGGTVVRVRTDVGVFEADRAVVASGSWSSALAADPLVVRPIRGQLVQVRLPDRAASQVIWGSRCYIVPWRDGTVLIGATVEDVGFDETATVAGVQYLLAAGAELMPPLHAAAFDGARVGLRPMTSDELPIVGPSSTMRHVCYATGHYRNGVLLAPLTASLVADFLLDGREGAELALMRPARLGL